MRRARLAAWRLVFASGDNSRFEDVDVSVNGERIALLGYEQEPAGGADGRGGRTLRTERILVRAGQHRVSAAFIKRSDGPYEDLIRPHDWSFAGGGSGGGGITTLPHLRELIISGPLKDGEIDRLMPFYEKSAAKDGFEGGVRAALEAILASPYFIFRLEREPDAVKPGMTYRVADADLASRLSFFLW